MELKTKYITPDDFKAYFGIDLYARLKSDDNPSNTANAFLLRVENRMQSFINSNLFRDVEREYKVFTDYQKEHYKLALLEQAYYVLKNGDISTDSGYDQDEGIKATKGQLKNLAMCSNAIDELKLCGIWSRKIKTSVWGGLNGWFY